MKNQLYRQAEIEGKTIQSVFLTGHYQVILFEENNTFGVFKLDRGQDESDDCIIFYKDNFAKEEAVTAYQLGIMTEKEFKDIQKNISIDRQVKAKMQRLAQYKILKQEFEKEEVNDKPF